MLLEKLLKGANFSINIFNLEESKLFDHYCPKKFSQT